MTIAPTIGLEIHAELATKTKLFCRCLNVSDDLTASANSAICPTCVGLPGSLPVPNAAAVAATVALGQSLGARIAVTTKWDRKNYFYPDLPKGYQISQYDQPLCAGGAITLVDGHRVALTRVHLEEDTGKLIHAGQASLIDYNRAGVPLLELVTEPVIASATEAKAVAKEYQRHLNDLAIAHANMEKGQMRCEANVSVALAGGDRLSGVKVEIKNLNSFKSLERAIESEIARQIVIVRRGGRVESQTRGWDEAKGQTYPMRQKETANDYRYFPEPDLPPFTVSPASQLTGSTRGRLRDRLRAAGADDGLATVVVDDPARRATIKSWLVAGLSVRATPLAIGWLAQRPGLGQYSADEMVVFFHQDIDPALRQQVLAVGRPGQLAHLVAVKQSERGGHDVAAAVKRVVADQPAAAARYRVGERRLLGYFVGQVKKRLGGGDPTVIAREVERQLQ